MLETLDYTIRIGSTRTFLYFDLYKWETWFTFAYVTQFFPFLMTFIVGSNFRIVEPRNHTCMFIIPLYVMSSVRTQTLLNGVPMDNLAQSELLSLFRLIWAITKQ